MSEKIPPTIPRFLFIRKFVRSLIVGAIMILLSLGIGILGYSYYENMSFVDAYVNAAMILSGMGPVSELKTDAGKIFAGSYALFSGIFFLVIIAITFSPLIHRFLHKFHMEDH